MAGGTEIRKKHRWILIKSDPPMPVIGLYVLPLLLTGKTRKNEKEKEKRKNKENSECWV